MRSVWQHLRGPGKMMTLAAPPAHASSPPHVRLKRMLGVSVQAHGVGGPASDSQSRFHSHLDSVTEMVVATAASATVSNVVGMIGTEAGLSVQLQQ